MTGFLLTYVAESLQKSPERVFDATDLRDRAEEGEIEDLVRRKILTPRGPHAEGSAADSGSYTVDVAVIGRAVSKAAKLKGPAEPIRLDPRLLFLGTSSMKAETYAWFLVLAHEDGEVAALLERKGGTYTKADRVVAVMATKPVASAGRPPHKLDFVTLGELGLTKVRNEAVRRKRLASSAAVTDDALAAEIALFPSRSRIDIPGNWSEGHYSREERREGATLNEFKVNADAKHVGDALFLFLLRLIVGLFEERQSGGYVKNSVFDDYDESLHLTGRELDGQVSRLRQHLRGSVEDAKQFIDRKRGYTRLGVHPSLITFNRAKLITHPNKAIRKLAERLPVQP